MRLQFQPNSYLDPFPVFQLTLQHKLMRLREVGMYRGGGGREAGQYIQELQLIVRASLPPELCCAVHVYSQYNLCTGVRQSAF